MKRPRSAVEPGEAAALMAVMRGARDVDEVAEAIGLSRTQTWKRMRRLADDGLIIFAEGRRGTLRPLVGVVAVAR